MSSYSTSEFKAGLKVLLDNEPCSIIENEFVKPGKGQAFNRVKLRNLISGRVLEKTFKSGEKLLAADVLEIEMQYLYNDGDIWHFMRQDNYEQYEVSTNVVGDVGKWLKEQELCSILLWNNRTISVNAPNFVILEVVETDPGVKGDTATGGLKPATLVGGGVVKVPLFVQIGDNIKVDTRTEEYVSRA